MFIIWHSVSDSKMHFRCNQSFLLFIFLAFQSFYLSIFLASSGSFTVKNDNIHSFFSLFWLQILKLPASLQNKNTRAGPFPWKRSVLQNPDRERTYQSEHRDLPKTGFAI